MRLGIFEIVIIIVVIIVIALITRIIRVNRGAVAQSKKTSTEIPTLQSNATTSRVHRFLKRIGVTLILTGGILLLAGISMFRWAFQSYIWSFIMIAMGLVIVLLSRKK